MKSRIKVTSAVLAGALAISGVAAAATQTWDAQFDGGGETTEFAEISMTVKIKNGKPTKIPVFSFGPLVIHCQDSEEGVIASGSADGMKVRKTNGKYTFEETSDDGGSGVTVHVEGAFKSSLKKLTGELDYSRTLEGSEGQILTCSAEDLAFSAKKG